MSNTYDPSRNITALATLGAGQIVPQPYPMAPAPYAPSIASLGAVAGDPRYSNLSYRPNTPELAIADSALIPGTIRDMLAPSMVPAVTAIDGQFVIDTADFMTLASLKQAREAAGLVDILGRNDQKSYTMSNSSGTFSPDGAFSEPNIVLGLAVEWSVQLLSAQAFTMQIATTDFRNMSYAPVDRTFKLRISTAGGNGSAFGGIFSFPFAQRQLSGAAACGFSTTAQGGMTLGTVSPAVIPNFVNATQRFPPFIIGATANRPSLTITMPSSVASAASVTVYLLSASSPWAASWRAATLLGPMASAAADMDRSRGSTGAVGGAR